MEGIKKVFAQCKKEKRSALVTYVTAGFPTSEETVDILLGMEAGGAGTNSLSTTAYMLLISLKILLSSDYHLQILSRTDQLYRKLILKL